MLRRKTWDHVELKHFDAGVRIVDREGDFARTDDAAPRNDVVLPQGILLSWFK